MTGNRNDTELKINDLRKRVFDVSITTFDILELETLAKASIGLDVSQREEGMSGVVYDYWILLCLDKALYETIRNDGKIKQFEESIGIAISEDFYYYYRTDEHILGARIYENNAEGCRNAIKPTKEMLDAFQKCLDKKYHDEKKADEETENLKSKEKSIFLELWNSKIVRCIAGVISFIAAIRSFF